MTLEEGKSDLSSLYADDTIIFREAKNWRKSGIFPIKEVLNLSLARILGCKVEHLPTTYLGMPLGPDHKELEIWGGIIEKREKKLANWKLDISLWEGESL
ncbi:hypothetical protein H5410_028888 [Solanum commersonii]|uniref:Reverse transcriptase n=1 Tax=Solanum commersonii TaxID=4109 RepID=A0A9J5Z7G3_SOLCO|nr:hypothetical protein H5410_028888 [Solanum commersonii]